MALSPAQSAVEKQTVMPVPLTTRVFSGVLAVCMELLVEEPAGAVVPAPGTVALQQAAGPARASALGATPNLM